MVDMGALTWTQDIIDDMSSQNQKSNGKFNAEGIYCMDFYKSTDTTVGTTGHLWYYEQVGDYPLGEEPPFMDTCAGEVS